MLWEEMHREDEQSAPFVGSLGMPGYMGMQPVYPPVTGAARQFMKAGSWDLSQKDARPPFRPDDHPCHAALGTARCSALLPSRCDFARRLRLPACNAAAILASKNLVSIVLGCSLAGIGSMPGHQYRPLFTRICVVRPTREMTGSEAAGDDLHVMRERIAPRILRAFRRRRYG